MWMAVTSALPTTPVQGSLRFSLVGLSPKAVTMAFISRGIGARMTTRRRAGSLAMVTACLTGERYRRCGTARGEKELET